MIYAQFIFKHFLKQNFKMNNFPPKCFSLQHAWCCAAFARVFQDPNRNCELLFTLRYATIFLSILLLIILHSLSSAPSPAEYFSFILFPSHPSYRFHSSSFLYTFITLISLIIIFLPRLSLVSFITDVNGCLLSLEFLFV